GSLTRMLGFQKFRVWVVWVSDPMVPQDPEDFSPGPFTGSRPSPFRVQHLRDVAGSHSLIGQSPDSTPNRHLVRAPLHGLIRQALTLPAIRQPLRIGHNLTLLQPVSHRVADPFGVDLPVILIKRSENITQNAVLCRVSPGSFILH